MILLDTDHLSVLTDPPDSRCAELVARIGESADQSIMTTVVSVEEQLRGWLALIHRSPDVHKQLPAYARLTQLMSFYRDWDILPFDRRAADEVKRLRKHRIRMGTQDLKIACIALVQNALLLSANLRDFQLVPGLRVKSWLG